MSAINAAIGSTLGVLTITGVLDEKVAGSIGIALGAWILVGALLLVRPKVTPNQIVDLKVQDALYTAVPKGPKPEPSGQ